MLQERDRSSLLKRIDTGPRLWLGLGLLLFNVIAKNYIFSITLLVLSVAMIISEKQFGLFKVIRLMIIVLFISYFIIYGTMAPEIDPATSQVAFTIFGIKYYWIGLSYGSMYFMRIAPLLSSLFLLFFTMDMTDLAAIMCNLGIPYKRVFTFVDSFQVITLLQKDSQQIQDAQRSRGLETEGNVIQRIKAFVPIIIPVVSTSIAKVQDQAIAMDTKGFNSTCKKTVYRELLDTKEDKVVRIIGILLTVSILLYVVLTATGVISPFLNDIVR